MPNFVNYVTYTQFGGIDKSIPKDTLEAWLRLYETIGSKVYGIWELRRSEIHPDAIEVRLAPEFELDQRDNMWRSWNYTFYPYMI